MCAMIPLMITVTLFLPQSRYPYWNQLWWISSRSFKDPGIRERILIRLWMTFQRNYPGKVHPWQNQVLLQDDQDPMDTFHHKSSFASRYHWKIDNLHKFLPKGKFPSNLPFRKARYSPNNLPDFTSGMQAQLWHWFPPVSVFVQTNPRQWCLDVLNSARVSN